MKDFLREAFRKQRLQPAEACPNLFEIYRINTNNMGQIFDTC